MNLSVYWISNLSGSHMDRICSIYSFIKHFLLIGAFIGMDLLDFTFPSYWDFHWNGSWRLINSLRFERDLEIC